MWDEEMGGFDYGATMPELDWQGALKTAGGFIGGIAKTASELYTARQSLANQRELNAVNLERARLGNALAVTQAAGAVDIAKAQIGAQVARERAAAAGYQIIETGGGGLNLGLIALLGLGVFAVVKFAK